jgi:TnpA family transposase
VLNDLARHRIDTNLITENWEDMLRVVGSLKLGTADVTELMRTLQSGRRPSTLARAIGEVGRIAKSLFLLSYIDDEAYRRRILIQLNKGESRHSLARKVFYGRKGEIRQRYREGQEEQLNALGLVVNAVILWNTMYIDRALEEMRQRGMTIDPSDVARLSPIGHEHVNVYGKYSFTLAESIRQGAFHPLRELDETENQEGEQEVELPTEEVETRFRA